MHDTSDNKPPRASRALLCFRISGAGLLLVCAGLLVLAMFSGDQKAPWTSACVAVGRYAALLALLVAVCSAAVCLYGRWAVLLGALAVASAAAIYLTDDNATLLWVGLCGIWSVICLLFPAVGHALRRKSLYSEELDDTTAD